MSVITSVPSSTTISAASTGAPQVQQAPQKKPLVTEKPKVVEQPIQKQEAPVDSEHLKKMITQANTQMAGAGRQHLSFGYEERINRMYVQIKDNETGEVVREIPPRQLIEQMAKMSEMIGILLDRNA